MKKILVLSFAALILWWCSQINKKVESSNVNLNEKEVNTGFIDKTNTWIENQIPDDEMKEIKWILDSLVK